VRTERRFWLSRLAWRLRGATLWPAFAVLTVVDALLMDALPPARVGIDPDYMTIPLGLIAAGFGNLILVGIAAPWLTRRLAQREAAGGEEPSRARVELLGDRVGTALLVLGCLGVIAAGLGSRPIVVSETEETEENARLVRATILHTGDRELVRNLETANVTRLSTDFFRTCVARDDRRRFYCLLVDTGTEPPKVTKDPSELPNEPRRSDR
jgi:hypothetical protein